MNIPPKPYFLVIHNTRRNSRFSDTATDGHMVRDIWPGRPGPCADCANATKDELAAVHSARDQDGYPIAPTTAASRKNNSARRVLQILSIF